MSIYNILWIPLKSEEATFENMILVLRDDNNDDDDVKRKLRRMISGEEYPKKERLEKKDNCK